MADQAPAQMAEHRNVSLFLFLNDRISCVNRSSLEFSI